MRNQFLVEQKVYRQRGKRKKWKSRYNFNRNLEKKSEAKRRKRKANRSRHIKIPEVFSLASNRHGVLNFFGSLKKISKDEGKFLFFDFSSTKIVSHGAITILLSHIGWLNDQGFHASGNYPIDKSSKEAFEKSGFLNFFKTIGTRKYEKGENTIVAVGETKINSVLSAELIRKSTKTIWGVEERNLKVQGMLIELMANTINHAYLNKLNQKGWYFSVDHSPEDNSVKFCFVDNGVGILNTINKKFRDKLPSFFRPSNIIERAFEGEFGSRTKQSNRGRGLRSIKRVFDNGHIKSLIIITNNIYYDFEKNITEELKENFDGTFYFWTINKSCNR